MRAFFEILNRLLIAWEKFQAKQTEKRQQQERDALERNPADWFVGHFDGLRDTEAADSTDKTEPHNRGQS